MLAAPISGANESTGEKNGVPLRQYLREQLHLLLRRTQVVDQKHASVPLLVPKHEGTNVVIFGQKNPPGSERFLNDRVVAWVFSAVADKHHVVTGSAKHQYCGRDNVRVRQQPHLFRCHRWTVRLRPLAEAGCIQKARIDVRALEHRIGVKHLLARGTVGKHVEYHGRRDPPSADNGLTAHFSGFRHDATKQFQFGVGGHTANLPQMAVDR